MPDTLKAQHVSRLTSRHRAVLGHGARARLDRRATRCGWHDTITGHLTTSMLVERWGALSYQEARNDWRRSARDLLLVELAKHGLGQRDLVANVNFFTKVAIGEDGELSFVSDHSPPGSRVRLRFELDTLVVLASAPHPLDPAVDFKARPVRDADRSGRRRPRPRTPSARPVPENERGFAASEAALL